MSRSSRIQALSALTRCLQEEAAAIAAGCVQETAAVVAPALLGGAAARTPLGDLGFTAMDQVIRLSPSSPQALGSDWLFQSLLPHLFLRILMQQLSLWFPLWVDQTLSSYYENFRMLDWFHPLALC